MYERRKDNIKLIKKISFNIIALDLPHTLFYVCVCVCVCVCVSMHVCVCTFAEGAALSRYLDGVLAALFAGHGGAVGVPVHTLTEGAVVLLPLLLVLT